MKRTKSSPILTVISLCFIAAVTTIVLVASTRSSRAANFYSTIRLWVTEPQKNAPLVGEVTLTATAGTTSGSFTTLKGAFDAINAGTHQGVIAISINANTTEGTATAALNASGSGSTSYTSISIQPAGGAARTISGATTGGNPLINLNGADNVTIDGLNTGGNSLTIANTTASSTSSTSTIRFIGGATNNTITRCSIQGSFSGTVATNGGTIYFATDAVTANGNDNNTISLCDIGPAGANLPSKAIYASGSATTLAIQNSGNIINNNNVFDFFRDTNASGIHILDGNDNWTISNNRIYQTAARAFAAAASRYAAITLNSTTGTLGAFTVTGNTIGFANSSGTGTTTITGSSNEFRGIDAPSVNTSTATSIQGNTISGINQTSSRASTTTGLSSFIAISAGTTSTGGFGDGLFNIGNVTGNTIGSLDGSSTIVINETSATANTAPVIGVYNFSNQNTNISNNNIGAITIQSTGTVVGFRGLLVNTNTALSATINSNIIGGAVAGGAITDTQVGSYAIYGIQSALPNVTIIGNTIRNMSGASNVAGTIISGGILVSGSTGANTISQNTVHSLSNASGAGSNSIYGMSLSLPATTNVIERNLLHSFSMTSTVATGQLWGISTGATGTATYRNNMIRLGINAAGASITTGFSIIGIRDAAGATNNFYHNSVYIGGSNVVSASNSYCFFSDVVTVTRSFQDNIFWNARGNTLAGGVAHIAIRVGGTAANPTGLTSNYNDLHFSGTDGATGVFNGVVVSPLSAWRTATGQDANSIAADPLFTAPIGTSSTVDLHVNLTTAASSPVNDAGTPIGTVINDFDGETRSATAPDIGADEFVVNFASSGSGNLPVGTYDSITINSPDVVTIVGNIKVYNNILVKNGATLNCGTFIVSGPATFTIEAGGTLGVGSTTGITTSGATGNIQVTGARTYTAGANYVYNGAAAQVTGNALSNAPNNLTINNAAGVTSSVTGLTVTGTLRVQAGTFTSASTYNNVQIDNSATLAASSGETINVTGNWLNNGTFTTNGSTVVFNGASTQTISGSGPTTFAGLTINNSAGVTLGVNTIVSGVLALTNGDLNTTNSFTLFMGSGATSTGTGDVKGSVNRTDIGATTRSFGNPDVQITETAGSVSSITVNLVKGLTPNDFSNAVKRIYTITANNGALTAATVRLRYINSELNGNSEATLDLWRKDAVLGWQDKLQTARNDDMSGEQNWVELAGVTQFSDWVISGPSAPTDVAMMNVKATRYDKQVLLEWQTGYEVSNVGFNIYREKNGKLERVTPEPVAGSALIAGPKVELRAGLAYSWWDEDVADCGSGNSDCQNLRYWIEDIDLSGRTAMRGPFGVSEPGVGDQQPGDRTVLGRQRSSLLSALGRDASLAQTAEAATVAIEPSAKVVKMTAARMSIQSGVASQPAVKLSVQREGWYRVEQSDLTAAGLASDADPAMLQLLVDGKEVPMLVTSGSGATGGGGAIGGGKTTAWTGIEFYGIGINSPSTVNHVYWLVVGSQPGLRIATSDAKGGSPAPGSFAYAVERRDKTVYFPALKNGGAEKWFGPLIFNAQPVDQSVMVQHAASSGGGLLPVSLQGFTNTAHSVRVLFNGTDAGTMHFTGLQKVAQKFVIQPGNIHEGVNQIQLIGPPGTSDLSLVDEIQLNYFHTNTADNNVLRMPATAQQQVTIDGFTNSAIRVVDVTDSSSPIELKTTVNSATASKTASSSYSVTVTAPNSGARTLLAFATDQQKRPAQIAANQPSNYRDPGQRADYVVITRKDLIGSLDPLIELRKNQNLTSMMIDVEDLYDEFSFGNKSPQAVKDFLTYAKTSWARAPRFVVLAGDATYDPKNYAGLGDFDLVPTRLVETAYNEAATDDWFADVNGDGVPDMAIGRLPVRTPAEAAAIVAKLVSYDASAGSNTVLLVADRNSSFDFEAADTQLRSLIPASLTVTDIRRGQVGDANARSQLLSALNQGAKVVNYYGHGSTTVWTDAPILSASDAAGLTNRDHLSLVVSMTCLNGYFHAPSIESLGESLLKARGGAIAVWASSGLTDAQAQTVMSRDAISRLLSGASLTIGEVVALAKASTTDVDVRRTWILLGDPATRLR